MTVKRSRSAARVLSVLEGIARNQPVGVTELARLLADDKSAVQRAIMTLADSGWISAATGTPKRWQLTPHILTVARAAHSGNDLLIRARATMEALRSETRETVILAVPNNRGFIAIEALESPRMLRTVPPVGMAIPVRGSATSRAILPYMSPAQQREFLGGPPDEVLRDEFARTVEQGYAISDGGVIANSTNIAAPVFELGGNPVGALVVSAPSERLPPEQHDRIGRIVAQAARSISRDGPAAPEQAGAAAARDLL